MEDDGKQSPNGLDAANDNASEEAEDGDGVTQLRRLDRVVLDIARLIGRQLAREDFERLSATTLNDNKPCGAGDESGKADND